MSIIQLAKVTFVGLTADRDSLLTDLQKIGCLQIIPLASETLAGTELRSTAGAKEALKFLQAYPHYRRQETNAARFDAVKLEQQVLELRDRLHDLEDERDFLIKRLQDMKPWGDFVLPSLQDMGNYRLWFYVVPHHEMPKIIESALPWEIVQRDQRFCYVVIVSETEPDLTVPRVHLGYRSRHELEDKLTDVEIAIEDAEAERAALARWRDLFSQNINCLQDRAACLNAATQTYKKDLTFALQAWSPVEKLMQLEDYAKTHGFYFSAEAVKPEDQPPTLMCNKPLLAAGEDLVTFYMTPNYRTWDPSSVVFVSFVVFFAMILADAGYAAVLGLLLLMRWKKLGRSSSGQRFKPLLLSIVLASILFGVLVGSYFGVTPAEDNVLNKLHLIDMSNTNRMMLLSVGIGVFHIVLANVMNASCCKEWLERLPSIGWISIIFGAVALAVSQQTLGIVLLSLGALLIVLFTAPNQKPLARFLQGLVGLTRLTGVMGDILSYLRLFALGLGSASLAIEFNRMAHDVYVAYSGVGLVFALFILLFGHGVNLILGVASGVIHGLRLNVIEFFNWGLAEEGTMYKPFKQAEDNLWNR
jgi:V/A-type H+/Na+-transporting ATPase subunit I